MSGSHDSQHRSVTPILGNQAEQIASLNCVVNPAPLNARRWFNHYNTVQVSLTPSADEIEICACESLKTRACKIMIHSDAAGRQYIDRLGFGSTPWNQKGTP